MVVVNSRFVTGSGATVLTRPVTVTPDDEEDRVDQITWKKYKLIAAAHMTTEAYTKQRQ